MIRSVELENWKSHHETRLEFEEGVNALIGTMGSGKSSVLEAVVFGLFGTLPSIKSREVKLDDLIRRTPSPADKSTVEIEFEINEENYTVKREIERDKGTSRSELRKEGELIEAPSTTEVTEQVEKLLGLDFDGFTRAVYSEQNGLDLFLNMRAGERKEKIDELLKIDRFEGARKTVVKVKNNLEKELEQKRKELESLEEDIDEEEIEKLQDDLEERKEKTKELEEEIENLKEELEDRKEDLEDLEKLKENSQKLEKRKTKLETRKESIEERIEDIEEGLESFENPEEKLENSHEEIKSLEERKQKIEDIQKDLEFETKDIENLEDEIKDLEEEVKKFEKFEEVNDEIDELTDEIDEIKQKGNAKYAKRQTLLDSIETLEESDGECPTCGKKMDEEHRKKEKSKRKKEIKKLKTEEKKLRNKLDEKDERREKLEDKRDKLLEFKSSEEKLEKNQEELSEKKESRKELEEKLQELEEKFSEDRLDELKEVVDDLEKYEELEELKEKLDHIQEKLGETKEDLEELEFDEEKLTDLRDTISEKKESRSVKKKELDSEKNLIEEKEKRLEQMEKQVEKKNDLESEVKKADQKLDFIHQYKNGLEQTQIELREMFVGKLNDLMDNIWAKLYPYDDYYSIRLNAEKDYAVEILDSENNWISAQAEVSGGERHSAALVMRLGLAFTLSPKIQVLMLDEPTHNMDSSGVEELAETLRKRSSDLIEQLFIVTHDPALESAATGKLYQFEKKNTETGLTEVEEVK